MNYLRERLLMKARLVSSKKPRRSKKTIKDAGSNRRNARIAIREAALRGTTCVILYCRFTDHQVKRYEVIPTQYAYLPDKNGKIRKALWVQDCHEGKDRRQIKRFYFTGIIKAAVTDRRRAPKWPILIN